MYLVCMVIIGLSLFDGTNKWIPAICHLMVLPPLPLRATLAHVSPLSRTAVSSWVFFWINTIVISKFGEVPLLFIYFKLHHYNVSLFKICHVIHLEKPWNQLQLHNIIIFSYGQNYPIHLTLSTSLTYGPTSHIIPSFLRRLLHETMIASFPTPTATK